MVFSESPGMRDGPIGMMGGTESAHGAARMGQTPRGQARCIASPSVTSHGRGGHRGAMLCEVGVRIYESTNLRARGGGSDRPCPSIRPWGLGIER